MKQFLKNRIEGLQSWYEDFDFKDFFVVMCFIVGAILSLLLFIGLLNMIIHIGAKDIMNDNKTCEKLKAEGWNEISVYNGDRNSAELLIYARLNTKYGVNNWKAAMTNTNHSIWWKLEDTKKSN